MIFQVGMYLVFCVSQFVIYHNVFKFVIKELRKRDDNEI